jgi:glycogen operon protein
VDDSFLLLINAHHQPVTFLLPDASYVRTWEVVVDTADPLLAGTRRRNPASGGKQRIPARAMQVLRGH